MLTIKKIEHRGANRIGITVPYSAEINRKLKSLGATYSSTLRCWYLDYRGDNYRLLQKNFDNLVIENPKTDNATAVLVAGPAGRDLPPIATRENPGFQVAPFPEKAHKMSCPEHKAENSTLAQKLHLQLRENIGKYWVFSMTYHQAVSRELLKVKGIYWNKPQKVYMVLRHAAVKEKAEEILEAPGFFPDDYLEKEKPVKAGVVLIVQPHADDPRWMQVFIPPVYLLRERIKRFAMSRYSVPHGCYLLPAAPDVYKALTVHYEPEKVVFENGLPSKGKNAEPETVSAAKRQTAGDGKSARNSPRNYCNHDGRHAGQQPERLHHPPIRECLLPLFGRQRLL
jgi:hypothetical protein